MMQLLQQQMLQPLGGLVLGGVDAGFGQEARGVDLGLIQQVAQTRVFCFESVLLAAFSVAPWLLVALCPEVYQTIVERVAPLHDK